MRQSLPRSLSSLVLVFFLAAPVHSGDDKDKSPQDVFKVFAAAWKKGDVQACMSHLSADSQSAIAGSMLVVTCSEPGYNLIVEPSSKKGVEARKALDDILKRHGISSEDALRKIPKDRWDLLLGDKFPKNVVALGEMVKDKPAFVEDVIKVAAKHLGWEMNQSPEIEANVKDVKIDGERAKGQVTIPSAGGKERTDTVYFKLENEVWKIDLIPMMEEPPRASPPAPSRQVQPQATPSYSRPGLLRRLLDRLRNW